MKSFAISLIVTLVKSMMDNGLVATIQELIQDISGASLSGEQKRAEVLSRLAKLGGLAFAATAPVLINLLLESLVLQMKNK